MNHYQTLTNRLKNTNSKQFYAVMKEICGSEKRGSDEYQIQELYGKSTVESAEVIANHFAKVSQSY